MSLMKVMKRLAGLADPGPDPAPNFCMWTGWVCVRLLHLDSCVAEGLGGLPYHIHSLEERSTHTVNG